jgi:hypothetical protein
MCVDMSMTSFKWAIALFALLSSFVATGRSSASTVPTAIIRGTLEVCGPGPAPAVSLHDRDGTVVRTEVWRTGSSARGSGRRTLDFSFSVRRKEYYLTMNNEYQMPPQARQIDLAKHRIFTTRIVACD